MQRNDSQEGLTVYSYDDNDRLLSEVKDPVVTTYTYDNNGNTLSKTNADGQVFYNWDFENRLIGADTDGDGTANVEYQYDADGIRVAQSVSGQEMRFLIDTNQPFAQVLEEYAPGVAAEVFYVYGNDLIFQERDGEQSFYHVDGLGSTRVLTDENGLASDRYSYDAFGQIIARAGDTENNYLFAGEQRDAVTGIDYLRARYMDPATGRFLSRDTFPGFRRVPISLHRYLYANANPVMFVDPSGLTSVSDFIAANKIQNILNTSLRLGNSYLNILDKVDSTLSIIDSIWMVFKIASNPSSIIPDPSKILSLDLTEISNLDDAVVVLRANAGRIVTTILTRKIPSEINSFKTFFNSDKSNFAFFPPSLISLVLSKSKVLFFNTGLQIQGKPVQIVNNSRDDRLFGVGMGMGKKNPVRIQFFRMDYGDFNHCGTAEECSDKKNHLVWKADNPRFHFHVPKN